MVEPANLSTLNRQTKTDELVFIDTPPAGEVMLKALTAADMVITPMSDTAMDYQQTWITLRNIPSATPRRVLLTRVEETTRAFSDLVAQLQVQQLPYFESIVRKRQPLKIAIGTRPVRLYEYGDVLNELLGITRAMTGNAHE